MMTAVVIRSLCRRDQKLKHAASFSMEILKRLLGDHLPRKKGKIF